MKNDEFLTKSKKIEKMEKKIKNLEKKLKRQPTEIEIDMCNKLQQEIQKSKKKIKNLKQQMDIAKNDFFESQLVIKNLDKEMRDVKMKYLMMSRKVT